MNTSTDYGVTMTARQIQEGYKEDCKKYAEQIRKYNGE